LAEKGVTFLDKDVSVDLQAREEMVKKSGRMGVPVIEVDGKLVIGFNRTELDKLLI
jgi:glutaredoxin 3